MSLLQFAPFFLLFLQIDPKESCKDTGTMSSLIGSECRERHQTLVTNWGKTAAAEGAGRTTLPSLHAQLLTLSKSSVPPENLPKLGELSVKNLEQQFQMGKQFWNQPFHFGAAGAAPTSSSPTLQHCERKLPTHLPTHSVDSALYACGSPSRSTYFDEMKTGASDVSELLNKQWETQAQAVQDVKLFCGMSSSLNQTLVQDPAITKGGKKIVLVCKAKACGQSSCPFKVTVRKRGAKFHVDKNSSCFERQNCFDMYRPSSAQLLRSSAFSSSMSSTGGAMRPREALQLTRSIGLATSYQKARRATVKYRETGTDNWTQSFGYIAGYLELAKEQNPGSFWTMVQWDGTNQFGAAGWVCGPLAQIVSKIGMDYCGIDAEHFRTKGFKYKAMNFGTRVAINDESDEKMMNVRPVATIHPSETTSSYTDLAVCIKQNPDLKKFMGRDNMVVLSDRFPGIRSTVEAEFPNAFHAFCSLHIMRNGCNRTTATEQSIKGHFFRFRNAFPMSVVADELAILASNNADFAQYVANNDIDRWQIANIIENHPNARLFGQQTSNVVEQQHASDRLSDLRDSHPFHFFQGVLQSQHKSLMRMKTAAEKVPQSQILVPIAEKKRIEFMEKAQNYGVQQADTSGRRFYVSYGHFTRQAGMKSMKFIDLDKPWELHGACLYSHQNMAPCQHYYAALHFHDPKVWPSILGCATEIEMYEKLYHPGYLMKNVREAINEVTLCVPCVDNVAHDGKTEPPEAAETAEVSSRKRQDRILSQGEEPKRKK